MRDLFGYEGKSVVVTGAASGMGQATARLLVELGAVVYALDVKEVSVPVKKYLSANLMKKESIEAAVAQIPGAVRSLFNCAGLPGPPFSDVETCLVNFVGHRHLTELLLPRMGEGSAIVTIASLAGMGWPLNLPMVMQLVATQGFDAGKTWLEENAGAVAQVMGTGYSFSKQCNIVSAKAQAWELAKRKIRINSLSPSSTETPMMPTFIAQHGKENIDGWVSPIGRYAFPEEMAEPLVFLNSNMARYISGQDLQVDYGTAGAFSLRQG